MKWRWKCIDFAVKTTTKQRTNRYIVYSEIYREILQRILFLLNLFNSDEKYRKGFFFWDLDYWRLLGPIAQCYG